MLYELQYDLLIISLKNSVKINNYSAGLEGADNHVPITQRQSAEGDVVSSPVPGDGGGGGDGSSGSDR